MYNEKILKRRQASLNFKRNYPLYLFLLPAVIYVIIFNYIPIYGAIMAFQNYNPGLGFIKSPFVGFRHFRIFFQSPSFVTVIRNTLSITGISLIAGFPAPIILALSLNYAINKRFKKTIQTITYAPYFISTVVIAGMLILFLSPSTGLINHIIKALGFEPVFFMGTSRLFAPIFVVSGIWQHIGYSSIIFIAALSSISHEIHESSIIDGATKLQRIWHIDLAYILPTIIILLILRLGSLLSIGFEKVYLLQNNLNLDSSEVIATYVYKTGLLQGRMSFAAAAGLFNNTTNFIMLLSFNAILKKITGSSLF